MSSIYFNTPKERVSLAGSERTYFGQHVNKMTLAILSELYDDYSENLMEKHLPENFHSRGSANFKRDFETWYMIGGGFGNSKLKIDGNEIDPFSLSLNTAVLSGSEQVNLMARLHAQCEVHGYFMPEDFDFFIEVMKDGLERKMFRGGQGWDEVISLFKRSKTPIVTSFSVTDRFPNTHLSGMEWDEFEKLTPEEAFELCFKVLNRETSLRISKSKQLFSSGISAFNFVNV